MSSAPAPTHPPPSPLPKPVNPEPLEEKESVDPEKGRVRTPQPGKSEHPTQ